MVSIVELKEREVEGTYMQDRQGLASFVFFGHLCMRMWMCSDYGLVICGAAPCHVCLQSREWKGDN